MNKQQYDCLKKNMVRVAMIGPAEQHQREEMDMSVCVAEAVSESCDVEQV